MAKKETTPQPAKKAGTKDAKATKTKAEAAKVKPAAQSKPAAKPAPVKPAPAPKKTAAPAKKTVPAKVAAKPAPAKAAPKPAPKPAAKPAPKAAPAKAPAKKAVVAPAPPKAVPSKAAPQKVAPAPKPAAAAKEAPKKAAAPKAAPAPKPVAEKKPASRKPVVALKSKPGQSANSSGSGSHESDARKLAIQKIQAKRNQAASDQRPAPSVVIGLEPSQPTGMYNGIVVTHEIKPFAAKTPYSKQELDKLREALLEEREKLLGQLASLQGVSMEAMVSAKEHAGYSIHIAEHASDLQTAEANMGVRTIEEERLEQVESALDRIENNQRHYGLCMACGNKIGIQRLIAVPHAHLCMPCRQRYETIRSRRGY